MCKNHNQKFVHFVFQSESDAQLFNCILDQLINEFNQPVIAEWVRYQLHWYTKKANHYRLLTHAQILLSVGLSLFTTALIGTMTDSNKVYFQIGSAIFTLIISYLSFKRPGEQWIRYRSACERLKMETIRFICSLNKEQPEYIQEKSIQFIECINTILSNELDSWSSLRLGSIKETLENLDSSLEKPNNTNLQERK